MAQPCDHSVSSYFDDCHVSGAGNFGKALSQRQNAYSAQLAHFTAIVKDYLGGLEILRSFHVLHLTQKKIYTRK